MADLHLSLRLLSTSLPQRDSCFGIAHYLFDRWEARNSSRAERKDTLSRRAHGKNYLGPRDSMLPEDVWAEALRHYGEQGLGALLIAITLP